MKPVRGLPLYDTYYAAHIHCVIVDFIGFTFFGFALETCTGVVCACLPLLRPVFKRDFSRNSGYTRRSPIPLIPNHNSHFKYGTKQQATASMVDPSSTELHEIHSNAISPNKSGSVGPEESEAELPDFHDTENNDWRRADEACLG